MKFDKVETLVTKYGSKIPSGSMKFDNAICRAAATYDDELAGKMLQKIVAWQPKETGWISFRQEAYATLGTLSDKSSAAFLAEQLSSLASGKSTMKPGVKLDLLDAVAAREEADLKDGVKKYWDSITDEKNLLAKYQHTILGGKNDAGEKVFFGKTEVSCVRCHKIDGEGGEVGPDLSGIALTRDRKYLLESIVHPNAQIAEGFTQQIIVTIDGLQVTGIVTEENDEEVKLMDADGNVTTILIDDIEGRKKGESSMPADLVDQLTQKEIRDLVEYLAGRKSKVEGTEHGE